MPYFDGHDGTRLFYKDWGHGQPVVFLASAAVSSDIWQYQMAQLAVQGFRCIGYDRRGHGRSDDPGRGYDYDSLADDLAALVDRLDLRNMTLVGHSMAGGEIVRYLSRHGDERVASVVLVSAMLPFPVRTRDNPDGIDGTLVERVRDGWYRDYAAWYLQAAPAFFGDDLSGCHVSDGLKQWTINDMADTSLQAAIECNHAIFETDFSAEMRTVRVPTLIIHGDHDATISMENSARRSVQLVAGSVLKVYANGSHGLYFTHMDQLEQDLLRFIRGQHKAGAAGTN
jgi:non-heme chloroperoxidase